MKEKKSSIAIVTKKKNSSISILDSSKTIYAIPEQVANWNHCGIFMLRIFKIKSTPVKMINIIDTMLKENENNAEVGRLRDEKQFFSFLFTCCNDEFME